MKLWLDDVRPAPEGWTWVKTVEDAKRHLLSLDVEAASLDHDLGACEACLAGRTPEQWLEESGYTQMPQCEHVGTGYTLVSWMEAENIWPDIVKVHSANPVGRKRMQQVIDKAIEARY